MQENKKNSYSVPAVDGMLDIVEFMAQHQQSHCGVTELSRELGLSTNLVFRIMKRLEERGYAERDSDTGGYLLSSGFFSLGMKLYSRFELRRIARRYLEKLSKQFGETTQLQVLNENKMLVLEVITPSSDFFLQVIPGSRLHVHCNAYGKAVLAFMEADKVDEILPKKLTRMTPSTIVSKTALRKELEKIKRTGISYDNEEYNTGIFCVSAPVFDVNAGIVGSLGLTGLSTRFCEKRLPEAEKLVFECAELVSKEIGYNGNLFTELRK